MKKLILLALLAAVLSCGKDFGDLNTDPNNPPIVPPEALLTSAEKTLADNLGIYQYVPAEVVLSQHWAKNNYTEPTRYAIYGDFSDYWWAQLYARALQDLGEIQRVVAARPGLDAAQDRNRAAIAKVMQAHTFQVLTDCFGPVPYSDALKGSAVPAPKYDSQRDIYLGLLTDLHDAIGQMDTSAPSFGVADVIYGGDVSKWKKLAHSLVLRLALRMADVEPDKARSEAEFAVAGGVFAENDDNACFRFLAGRPNNSPYNTQRIERGDADLGLSNVLIDNTLKPLNDPRLPKFADERVGLGGGYFGRPYGQNSDNAAGDPIDRYSQPSGAAVVREGRFDFKPTDVLRPDATACLMGRAEVCFALAEGRERGWSVGGTAEEWYNKGIAASMGEWGVDDAAAIDAYLAQAAVKYDPGDWRQRIGEQKWVALFMQGVQAWAEWRRLDFQKLILPVDGAIGDVGDKPALSRLPYPSAEQGLNAAHYGEAVQLLGGHDDLKTRLWWDAH